MTKTPPEPLLPQEGETELDALQCLNVAYPPPV